jgi:hypothetical protein
VSGVVIVSMVSLNLGLWRESKQSVNRNGRNRVEVECIIEKGLI